MYIDRKETVWYRYFIDDEDAIKNNLTEDRVVDLMGQSDRGEYLFDTGEGMNIEENDGFATIEVYDSSEKLLWANGKR